MAETVLIVEDEELRLRWFHERYPHALVTRSVQAAITWLGTLPINHLYLDHDLGTEPFVGRDVAQWLALRPDVLPDLTITVHSVNVVSAPKILADLAAGGRKAEWIPFTAMIGATPVG